MKNLPIEIQPEFPKMGNSLAEPTNTELLKRIEKLQSRRASFLGALTLTAGDKHDLEAYHLRQHEALDGILEARNRGIKAMADAQASFISEMANSLLLRDRAKLKVEAGDHFASERLRLNQIVESQGRAFNDLIERKLIDAEQRPERIRTYLYDQIDDELKRWNEVVTTLLDDYHALLSDRV